MRLSSIHDSNKRAGCGEFLLWITTLAILAAGVCGGRPVAAQSDLLVDHKKRPIRIDVTCESTPKTAHTKQDFGIDAKKAPNFTGPIRFDFLTNLGELTCSLSGATLTMGVTNSGAEIEVEQSTAPLREDEKGNLILHIPHPERLAPGIYHGMLSGDFHGDGNEKGSSWRVIYDIIIVVHGRRLADIQFERVKRSKDLRVGSSAAVMITVQTVGCELGIGFLKLDWRALTSEEKTRALHVQVPLDHAIDPLTAFPQEGKQGLHPQWRDLPIWTEMVESEADIPVPDSLSLDHDILGKTHTIRVAVSDCFLPGSMQAEVEWEQAEIAPKQAPLLKKLPEQPVLSGILVLPKPAFRDEQLKVLVRGSTDHGKSLELSVTSPNQISQNIELFRKPTGAAVAGACIEYTGSFRPKALGRYQFRWPTHDEKNATRSRNDAKQFASIEPHFPEPVEVQVCFLAIKAINKPIEVFAGAPPVWVNESTGWKSKIPRVCSFGYDRESLQQAKLENLALFRRSATDMLVPHDPNKEPVIHFTRHGDENASHSPKETKLDTSGSRKTTDSAGQRNESSYWKIPPNTEQGLQIDMTVDLVREAGANNSRHRIGSRDYVQRMIIHANDENGRPVERLVEIPFTVKVSTDWMYYRKNGLVLVIGLSLILVCFILYRKASGPRMVRKYPTRGSSPPDPFAGVDDGAIFSRKSPHAGSAVGESESDPRPKTLGKKKSNKKKRKEKKASETKPTPIPKEKEPPKKDLWD